MNQQNTSKTPDLLVKRKRGRPRKDESVQRNVKQHTQAPLVMATPPLPPPAATSFPATTNVNKVDPNMVGQAVTCVIDGIFDNGYLLSACVGPNNSILRGIVFQQGHVAPVTHVNDVAPHVEMCTRGEFPIPPSNPRNLIQVSTPESVCAKHMQNDQNTPAPMQSNQNPPAHMHVYQNTPAQMQSYQNTPAQMQNYQNTAAQMQNYQNTPVQIQNYQSAHAEIQNDHVMLTGGSSSSVPQESLRLVEQDDVMQVFEVSKTVEESQDCDQRAKNEHVVSDPMAENFPERVAIVDKEIGFEPVVDANPNEQRAKEPDGEKPEVVTPIQNAVENQPSMVNDGLQQESQVQTGEMSNIGANQDQNRELAVDLSLSNFPEI